MTIADSLYDNIRVFLTSISEYDKEYVLHFENEIIDFIRIQLMLINKIDLLTTNYKLKCNFRVKAKQYFDEFIEEHYS